VTNDYLIQLVGAVLTVAGLIALTASAHVFGTPVSPAEKRRASDEWNRRRDRDAYRLPINLDTVLSAIFFLGGISLLVWSKFEFCAFLVFWFPSLPDPIKLLLSCR
jgi:hypothetical protein